MVVRRLRRAWRERRLPPAARAEMMRDRSGALPADPGSEAVIRAAMDWLCRAQDRSTSRDGGVARHFSLVDGWSTSYPETTGYIVPTVLDYADRTGDRPTAERGRRMLDWLVGIQFPEGGFQGGVVGATPHVPVAFNTGQILLGLASGVRHFGEAYREPMLRAAKWLVEMADPDGCWRRYRSPFAAPSDKAYDTHIAWALLETARVESRREFVDTAMANVNWALGHQRENGWMDQCALSDPSQPLTHTLGYALRGIVEAYRFTEEERLLEAALRTAIPLAQVLDADGRLAGRFDSQWRPRADWSCLTGTAQIACCWLLLFEITGRTELRQAAMRANAFIRRTVELSTSPDAADRRGGVKGSYPVDGDYGRFEYLNWACKFVIDANSLEQRIGEN